MRITKKIPSDLDLISSISRIGRRKFSVSTNEQNGKIFNDKTEKSFFKNDKSLNGELIKVQLVKNNPNKKLYSTKTIDVKAYNNKNNLLIKNKTDNNNYDIMPSKKYSSNIKIQNYKLSGNNNNDNNFETNINNMNNSGIQNKFKELGNIDKLKKYLIPKSFNHFHPSGSNINRPKVISVSPAVNNQYNEEENNNDLSINNSRKNKAHKIRDLLTQKFTYNKPKTTSIMNTPNHVKKNQRIYETKTFCNYNNKNSNYSKYNNSDNLSVNSFNSNSNIKLNKDNISINSFEDNKSSKYNNMFEIKLDDLIIYDEKLNDILVALNGKKNYEIDASNECAEFFVFYFHSTLQKKISSFFNAKNKIIIDSANNLTLLAIIITYHLSITQDILKDVIYMIINIFSLLKMNLYLTVKKIQIFYGDTFTEKNSFYFKTFEYYLRKQNLMNIKEEDILIKISHNCRLITNDIKKILKLYQQTNNAYHSDFIVIFNNISILSEKDINDYFFNKLYRLIPNKSNNNKNSNITNKKINISKLKGNYKFSNRVNGSDGTDKVNVDNCDVISVKSSKSVHYYGKRDNWNNQKILQLINDYEKNKIEAPFIKTPCPKKYTIVLDLDETLLNLEVKDLSNNKCILHLRPGLFSFLSEIKPFCELITFTSASKVYAQPIIKEIESQNKYFDYNFFREHSTIYGNDFIKDISKIGRDMKKIIIVDNLEDNFKLNKKNGIKIAPFYGDENDKVLFELKKLLVMIYEQKYEDLTLALKNYADIIKKKISMEN